MKPLRHLVLVLGDQLDLQASAFDGFDPAEDAVWMAEVPAEAEAVWSSQPRIALFLAAMRHFADELRRAGRPLHYTRLGTGAATLAEQLRADIARLQPQALVMTAPGEWRVLQAIREVARNTGLPLDVRDDRHFYLTVRDFAAHARGAWAAEIQARAGASCGANLDAGEALDGPQQRAGNDEWPRKS
ncbi:cryptochrome/photolyase family protein, partial [Roseateles paludis]